MGYECLDCGGELQFLDGSCSHCGQRREIADLKKELADLYSEEPCPKCGLGIHAGCVGCEIERLRDKTIDECANVVREMYIESRETELNAPLLHRVTGTLYALKSSRTLENESPAKEVPEL